MRLVASRLPIVRCQTSTHVTTSDQRFGNGVCVKSDAPRRRMVVVGRDVHPLRPNPFCDREIPPLNLGASGYCWKPVGDTVFR